jgi:hypothetical protein
MGRLRTLWPIRAKDRELHLAQSVSTCRRCYPDHLGPSGNFFYNSAKITCLEITSFRIKYSTVLWFLELQIRRGRKV